MADGIVDMANGLLYGKGVLNLVRRLHAVEGAALIIRHSERPPFDNVPIEEWDSVGLTYRGIEAANDFGKALAQDGGIRIMGTRGWGLKRCLDTADLIAAGAREGGCLVSDQGALDFRSPIADRRKYDKALGSGRWAEFVDEWLTGRAQDGALVPAHGYAVGFLRELLERNLPNLKGVSVIVTHDLQIYPLVGFLLDVPIRKLDFLNGLVIKMGSEDLEVGFEGTVRSAHLSELLS